jgi:hypothetical protein
VQITPLVSAAATSIGPHAPRARRPGLGDWLALAALAFAGCVANQRLSIVPQRTAAGATDPTLVTTEQRHRVEVRILTPTFSNRTAELPAFNVRVTNRGSTQLSLTAADVAVFSGSTPVRAYSAAELVERVRSESEREAEQRAAEDTTQMLVAASTRQDASMAPMMVKRAQTVNQATASQATTARQMVELANTIIPVTISPGAAGSGVVKLHGEDIAAGRPLRIVVTVESEAYEFVFDVNRTKS